MNSDFHFWAITCPFPFGLGPLQSPLRRRSRGSLKLFHLKRSVDYLWEDFGKRPLSLRAGGAAWSKSYANHTGRIAAQAGLGLFQAGTTFNFYLDRDLVLDMAGVTAGASHSYDRPLQAESWPAHPDGPLMVTAHDRDIALQPDFLDRFFQSLPSEYKTLSMESIRGLSAYTDRVHGWRGMAACFSF
jgi:hypothetical protein